MAERMFMQSEKKSFLEDENATGFHVLICSGIKGKTSITVKSRIKPGEPLNETSIEDASDAQLCAVCDVLDNL